MTNRDLGPFATEDPARRRAGNGLFLVAMVLTGVALLLGPVVVVTHSNMLLNGAIALGIIGVALVVLAAIRSFLA